MLKLIVLIRESWIIVGFIIEIVDSVIESSWEIGFGGCGVYW